jgi:hypothetical protein
LLIAGTIQERGPGMYFADNVLMWFEIVETLYVSLQTFSVANAKPRIKIRKKFIELAKTLLAICKVLFP